jgi:hypothetical protein
LFTTIATSLVPGLSLPELEPIIPQRVGRWVTVPHFGEYFEGVGLVH